MANNNKKEVTALLESTDQLVEALAAAVSEDDTFATLYGPVRLERVVGGDVYESKFPGGGISTKVADLTIPIASNGFELCTTMYAQMNPKTGKAEPRYSFNKKVIKFFSAESKALLDSHITIAVNAWPGWDHAWTAGMNALREYERTGGRKTGKNAIRTDASSAPAPTSPSPDMNPRLVKKSINIPTDGATTTSATTGV